MIIIKILKQPEKQFSSIFVELYHRLVYSISSIVNCTVTAHRYRGINEQGKTVINAVVNCDKNWKKEYKEKGAREVVGTRPAGRPAILHR